MFFHCSGATKGGTISVGDAQAQDVLTGKTFSNSSQIGAVGSMPNKSGWSQTATSNEQITIPAGYHDGTGKVTVNVPTDRYGTKNVTLSIGDFTQESQYVYSYKLSTSDGFPSGFQAVAIQSMVVAPDNSSVLWSNNPSTITADVNTANELVVVGRYFNAAQEIWNPGVTVTVTIVYTY